jgi:diaminohydroxyphosphoribosylaminopyrimidine deaminase / 5-amino-6-(5-phosphoribosylamino)uracil reductase
VVAVARRLRSAASAMPPPSAPEPGEGRELADISIDEQAMRRAAALARRGLGTTSPNPVVGCVIMDANGMVVGEGFHAYAGGPHAEIVALAAAGSRARGGTAVVTLEPCNHVGRTGPCSRALISAGVSRIVIGVADSNPVAAGGGEVLRAAGIEVCYGVGADVATAVNVGWLTSRRRAAAGDPRPYTIWKLAATLDGRAAAADGTSQWITSPPARADAHALRSTVDAIVVGVGTVLADDSHLTVRIDGRPTAHQPLRVVVDSRGRTPERAKVKDSAAPTWVATATAVGSTPDNRVDVHRLSAVLFERGCRRVLLEGGPTLAGSYLAAGLIDEVVAYLAPKLLGAGPSALAAAGIGSITEAIDLELTDVTRIGPDLRITAVPKGA